MNVPHTPAADGTAPALAPRDVVISLYRGILAREPDPEGLANYTRALVSGEPLQQLIASMIGSDEFASRQGKSSLPEGRALPDLTALYPEKFVRNADGLTVFHAPTDADIDWMEQQIQRHRYYDSFGVWQPETDLDKRVTAAMVQGLGAGSCLEIGCFSGPVLSVLHAAGVDAWGLDASHLAFLLARPEVVPQLVFGDLLDARFDRQFDVVFGMDILEHLNPGRFDAYLQRIASLLKPDGFVLINSPMFGPDDIFGTVFQPILPEWRAAGEDCLWRYMHCDDKGWPAHGHLVWAAPRWWEQQFARNGMVRVRAIEREVQAMLDPFFADYAPARKSLFILKHANGAPDEELALSQLATALRPTLEGHC